MPFWRIYQTIESTYKDIFGGAPPFPEVYCHNRQLRQIKSLMKWILIYETIEQILQGCELWHHLKHVLFPIIFFQIRCHENIEICWCVMVYEAAMLLYLGSASVWLHSSNDSWSGLRNAKICLCVTIRIPGTGAFCSFKSGIIFNGIDSVFSICEYELTKEKVAINQSGILEITLLFRIFYMIDGIQNNWKE